jgi:catechol 2,3-dioxygenase-like lactoylglutathione lyase family enzyme
MQWSRLAPELTVSDFAASLTFYTEVLGFSVAYVRGKPDFAYLDRDGIQIMLEEAPPSWPVGQLARPFGRGVNFEIAWDDATQLRDKLIGLHYPLYRDLQDSWRDTGETFSGAREFLIQDPDGYLLRFAQSLGERAK